MSSVEGALRPVVHISRVAGVGMTWLDWLCLCGIEFFLASSQLAPIGLKPTVLALLVSLFSRKVRGC